MDFSQELSGFVEKRSKRGLYQTRFFGTQRDFISYWKVKNRNSKPLGDPTATYCLKEVSIVSPAEDRFFHIILKNGKKFHLGVENSRQRDAWVKVLRAKVKKAQHENNCCLIDECLSFISSWIGALYLGGEEALAAYINGSMNEAFDGRKVEDGALQALVDLARVLGEAEVEIQQSCDHEPRLRAFVHTLVQQFARATGSRLLLELGGKYPAGRTARSLTEELGLEELRALLGLLQMLQTQARRCLEFGCVDLQDVLHPLITPVVVAAAVEEVTVQKVESWWANLMSTLVSGSADGVGEEAVSASALVTRVVAETLAGLEVQEQTSKVVAVQAIEVLAGLMAAVALERVIPRDQWERSIRCVCRFGASCLRVPRALRKAAATIFLDRQCSGTHELLAVVSGEEEPECTCNNETGGARRTAEANAGPPRGCRLQENRSDDDKVGTSRGPSWIPLPAMNRLEAAAVGGCQSALRFVAQVFYETELEKRFAPMSWGSPYVQAYVKNWATQLLNGDERNGADQDPWLRPACKTVKYLLTLGLAEVAVVNTLRPVFSRFERDSRRQASLQQKMTGTLTRLASKKKEALSHEEVQEVVEECRVLQAFLHCMYEESIGVDRSGKILGPSNLPDGDVVQEEDQLEEDCQLTRLLMLPTWVKSFLQMDEDSLLTMFAQAVGTVDGVGRGWLLALVELSLRLRPDFGTDRTQALLAACTAYLDQAPPPEGWRLERSDRLLVMLQKVVPCLPSSQPSKPGSRDTVGSNLKRNSTDKVPVDLQALVADLGQDKALQSSAPPALAISRGSSAPAIARLLADFDAADEIQKVCKVCGANSLDTETQLLRGAGLLLPKPVLNSRYEGISYVPSAMNESSSSSSVSSSDNDSSIQKNQQSSREWKRNSGGGNSGTLPQRGLRRSFAATKPLGQGKAWTLDNPSSHPSSNTHPIQDSSLPDFSAVECPAMNSPITNPFANLSMRQRSETEQHIQDSREQSQKYGQPECPQNPKGNLPGTSDVLFATNPFIMESYPSVDIELVESNDPSQKSSNEQSAEIPKNKSQNQKMSGRIGHCNNRYNRPDKPRIEKVEKRTFAGGNSKT